MTPHAASRPMLTVATLADERFVLPLATFGRSLLDHLRTDATVELLIIDGGISARSRERLLASWRDPRLTVRWRVLDPALLPSISPLARIPALTYARLLIPSLLADECESLVILDADQLILTDLTRLLDEPLGDALLLAPRDPFIPFISSPNGLPLVLRGGRDPSDSYFTGALMVLNLPVWRAERVSEQALGVARSHQRELHTHDQDALNAVVGSRWRELDPRWQVQPRALCLSPKVTPHLGEEQRKLCREDPWIVHFSGRLKPWLYQGAGGFDALFWECLQRTEFRASPPRNLKALAYQLYDGPLRRWLYPWEVRVGQQLQRAGRLAQSLLTR